MARLRRAAARSASRCFDGKRRAPQEASASALPPASRPQQPVQAPATGSRATPCADDDRPRRASPAPSASPSSAARSPPLGRQRRVARARRARCDRSSPSRVIGAGDALRRRRLGPARARRRSPARSRRPRAASSTACPGRRRRPARPPARYQRAAASVVLLDALSLRNSSARGCAGRPASPASAARRSQSTASAGSRSTPRPSSEAGADIALRPRVAGDGQAAPRSRARAVVAARPPRRQPCASAPSAARLGAEHR